MNIKDFHCMWRGKTIQPLQKEEAHLLSSVDKRGQGRERALLLLHGFSSSPAVYRRILPKATGYDAVVCPTLPGHADSLAAFTLATANDWVAAAEMACDELTQHYQTVDVMGLSLGGLIACHLSKQFSIHQLLLLAPSLELPFNVPLALKLAHILRRLGIKYLRNRAGNLYSREHCELAYRLLPIKAIIEVLTFVNTFQFSMPTCSTHLFLGRFDSVINSKAVERRFANAPNIHIHWLANSAHVLPLDSDLEAIAAYLYRSDSSV